MVNVNMVPESVFKRLIRCLDDEGQVNYGDLPSEISTDKIEGSVVSVLAGDLDCGFSPTSESKTVTKMAVPKHPVVFTKPANALAGPLDDIHIHPEVQEQLDYEGELTVVIGRDVKNVQANEALSYVLGYTCGNDFSARDYQVPSTVSGGQYSYAKSFDQLAPIGPCITSAALIPDPQVLSYVAMVNGEVRQKTSTADMIHSVKQVIAHLSRGTTLRKCTCIMMGTPSGVGLWMSPPRFLKDGDVVEVDIEQIVAIRNIVVFD